VISRLHPRFRADFSRLPADVRDRAREAYRRFAEDPRHPGLRFKRLATDLNLWSVRINDNYRAVGVMKSDNEIVWFFIGNHADYEHLLKGM
jgi:mRNA-degrading endonuclease RelE of RelBE toxin-antitoxin system